MRSRRRFARFLLTGALVAGSAFANALAAPAGASTFNVTSPGFQFQIDASAGNPTIALETGTTYVFNVSTASIHPFAISTSSSSFAPFAEGVTNNNISSGVLTFRPPYDAPASLFYVCTVHFFFGSISITQNTFFEDGIED
jgi:hypothetical protein